VTSGAGSSQIPTNPLEFLRAGEQRLAEARYLAVAKYQTAAIYLAGYTVECSLKALLLSSLPRGRRTNVGELLRGNAGHNFVLLKEEYIRSGGAAFPPSITKELSFVNSIWRTRLRHQSRNMAKSDASRFLLAAGAILEWAKGRL